MSKETLWSVTANNLRKFESNIAWTRRLPKGKKEYFTYRQILLAAGNFAAILRGQGIGENNRVGILAANGPEWGIAAFAAWKLGAILAPLHSGNSDEELHGQNKALKTDIVLYAGDARGLSKSFEIQCDFSAESAASELVLEPQYALDNVALHIATSGSTGNPKVVVLSHGNIISNVRGVDTMDLKIDGSDKFLSLLPLSHCMELTAGLILPLCHGSTIVLPRVLAANEILDSLVDDKISVLIAVPRLFRNIKQGIEKKIEAGGWPMALYLKVLCFSPLFLKHFLNKPLRKKIAPAMKVWASGGSRLDPEIAMFYRQIGFPMRQGYGLTECSPLVALQYGWDKVLDGVGKPFADIVCDIRNSTANGSGELWVSGPNVMLGYLDDDPDNPSIIDGWFNTGDIAKWVSGRIVLTGRSKRLIVTEAGKNVYPEDLEVLLERDPAVAEAGIVEVDVRAAAVLAIEDENRVEVAREVIKSYNVRASSHNQIVRFAVVEQLPRTPLGKIALAQLPRVFSEHEVESN
jgi:long-chain acyl-CoA synthetase